MPSPPDPLSHSVGEGELAMGKVTLAPSLRPIQLVCMVTTRSGQSIWEKSSSSSA